MREKQIVKILYGRTPWGQQIVQEHGQFFQVAAVNGNRLLLTDRSATSFKTAKFGFWLEPHDAKVSSLGEEVVTP